MINYKCGEFVNFRVRGKDYKYEVLCDHLHLISGDTSIWNALSLIGSDIIKFCEKAYGYPPHHVTYYNMGDYDAASRLIHALREKCDFVDLKDDIWDDPSQANASCKGVTTDYKWGDLVVFLVHGKQCTYQVGVTKLNHVSGYFVLDELHLYGKELKAFCEKAFGYPPEGCCGDNYKREDYAAATRLIKALEEKCAEASHAGRSEEVTSRPLKDLKYKKGDKVVFNVRGKEYEYEIYSQFLCCMDRCSTNDIIFKALNIETPVNFCTAAYGYAANPVDGSGAFPECIDGDIAALNRVIEALQKECDRANALHETYAAPTKIWEDCKRWYICAEEKDKDEALLTVRKSNTCKF